MNLEESTTTAIAITEQPERAWIANWTGFALQSAASVLSRVGAWGNDTAQRSAAVVAVLMGPAIVVTYTLALWSLAANLGWASSFLVSSGPLSNWIVWVGIAIAVHASAAVLRKHTQPER